MFNHCVYCSIRLWFSIFSILSSATSEIYSLSLHDALPIWAQFRSGWTLPISLSRCATRSNRTTGFEDGRLRAPGSEEHTSELQSPDQLVCRLLLENKNHGRRTCRKPIKKKNGYQLLL